MKKLVFSLLAILFVMSCLAVTIDIPGDYDTIQEGIDAAVDGDLVLVQPGIYTENLNYSGKNITVGSLYHTTQDTSYISQTIIDANQNGSAVLFESGEDSTAVLTGFHLQNGSGTFYMNASGYEHYYGGGVFCVDNSSPRLRALKISEGTPEYGGGICAYNNSLPIIENVEIYSCDADKGGAIYFNTGAGAYINKSYFHQNTGRRGAAIYFREAPIEDPIIENCVFYDNHAIERAGAIGTFNTNLTVKNCIMESNSADLGGAMFIWLQTITLQNVLFTNNSCSNNGGAIFSCQCASYYINSAFYDNVASGAGGAFYGWSSSSPYFVNSVLWGNSPQQIYCRDSGGENTVTCEYSCVEGGEAGISTVNTVVNWLDGNIDSDPLVDNDHKLTEASPCIDAGTDMLPNQYELTALDLAGEIRISGDAVDMGPYEFIQAETISFTQITTGDIVNNGGWNYACCWADFNADGWDDLFVCNNDADNGKTNFLYFNNNDGTFTRILSGDIVEEEFSSYGCAPGDYDNDGFIDLFVSNYNEDNSLFLNNGDGTFQKILTGDIVNDSGKSTDCEWIDYDNDGYLDLFVCNRDEVNFLYKNNGDATFTRILGNELVNENKNSGSCTWADFNDDGFLDVFITNSGPDYNSLFFNNGDGSFTALQNDPVVSYLENFDICTSGDYDNDGDFDIYAAPGMLPAGSYDVYLYQNNGDGSFARVTGIPHDNINSGGGCDMIDFDFDGDLDILHQAYDGFNLMLENDGAGNFSQITDGTLPSDGNYNKQAGWTDYDRDGDLDVFFAVNNYFGGNNKLFRNDGNDNSWLYVTLEGSTSNYFGYGAVIETTAEINGQMITQTKVVNGVNSPEIHFGFAQAQTITYLELLWPSGEVSVLENLSVNEQIVISEPQTGTEDDLIANHMRLYQNYPNPFNPETNIYFNLTAKDARLQQSYAGQAQVAKIEIFNLRGQMVKELEIGNDELGIGSVKWNGRDDNDKSVSSGVYFYRLNVDGKAVASRKMLLLK